MSRQAGWTTSPLAACLLKAGGRRRYLRPAYLVLCYACLLPSRTCVVGPLLWRDSCTTHTLPPSLPPLLCLPKWEEGCLFCRWAHSLLSAHSLGAASQPFPWGLPLPATFLTTSPLLFSSSHIPCWPAGGTLHHLAWPALLFPPGHFPTSTFPIDLPTLGWVVYLCGLHLSWDFCLLTHLSGMVAGERRAGFSGWSLCDLWEAAGAGLLQAIPPPVWGWEEEAVGAWVWPLPLCVNILLA